MYQATGNTALTANTTAFALKVAPGWAVSGGYTLTLGGPASAQAGLILDGGASVGTTTLAFAAAEGVVYSGGSTPNTISAVVSGTNGLTVYGPQALILGGVTNTYTGPTTVDGVLEITGTTDINLGAVPGAVTANNVVFNGGTLVTTGNLTLGTNRGMVLGGAAGPYSTRHPGPP